MHFHRDMLKKDLAALDEHDAQTRSLIDNPGANPETFAGRSDHRVYLNARVINAARLVLAHLEKLDAMGRMP